MRLLSIGAMLNRPEFKLSAACINVSLLFERDSRPQPGIQLLGRE
jgi:hypothetical protein